MRLLKWLSFGFAIWMIYWALAAWGLRSGVAAWFGEQERQGWQAEYSMLQTGGFPLHHETRILQPVLADPGTGTAWRADWLHLISPAIWPGHQQLRFSQTPQRFSYFDQTYVLTAAGMAADLQLAPGTALELEQMALQAGAWQLTQTDQPLFGADRFDLSMVQQERPADYRIRVQAQGFAPKGEIRRLLQVRRDQPEHFEALSLEADVRFDTPWDRRALELRRPQPRHIALSLAELRWGEIQFLATGDLNLDEAGWVSGELALQMENWRVLLDMLEKSRLLPSQSTRQGLEHLLELLAGLSGHPQKLNAKLRFQDGQAYAGPIPLGPAPRLVLR